MRIEYGEITSILKADPVLGAQLCHVKGKVTDREYQNCEIITHRGINYLPKIGDVVVMVEVHNGEIMILGSLEQFDMEMKPGEIQMHLGDIETKGQTKTYNIRSKIKFNKDMEIEIKRGETKSKKFETKTQMLFNKDFERKVEKGLTESGTFKPKQRLLFDKNDNIIISTLKTDGTEQTKITMKQNGDILIANEGEINIVTKGNISATTDGSTTLNVGGNLNANVSGTASIISGGTITLNAPSVQVI